MNHLNREVNNLMRVKDFGIRINMSINLIIQVKEIKHLNVNNVNLAMSNFIAENFGIEEENDSKNYVVD